jgi:hypothetical protein
VEIAAKEEGRRVMGGEEKKNRFRWEAESHTKSPVAYRSIPVFFVSAALNFHLTYKETGQKEDRIG